MAEKRNGAPNGEERELALAARKEFEAKNYSGCTDKLRKLGILSQNDPRIQHNMCVCHFHQSGFQYVDNLKKGLKQVCNQVHVDPDHAGPLEDTDHAVLFFNHAVILYHQQQHHQAIRILEKLFQVIEPLEEKLALQVLLLLAEACLCTQQPDKALIPLGYIDKQLASIKQGTGVDKGEQEQEAKSTESIFVSHCEKNKVKFHQLKIKCYLQLKHLRFCKRELKSIMTSSTGTHTSSALFLKSNFEYERGNYRKAIKLLNGSQQDSDPWHTGESVPVMYYNNMGCIHFYMGKYHLACHYAKKALQENSDAHQALVKKSNQRRTSRPLHTMGFSRHYELLYNAGIQLLHAGRPLAAFDCLIETVQVYSTNPRLWLRLAECCIAANKGSSGSESVTKGLPETHKHGIINSLVGSGQHRKVILSPGVTDKKYSTDIKSAAIPVSSMEFGSLCLCNALSLLPSKMTAPPDVSIFSTTETTESSEHSIGGSSGSKPHSVGAVPAPPGPSLKSHEIVNLKCSILVCSAYVSLVLGDHVVALQHAKDLLAIPGLKGSLKFLGDMYAAEAHVHLNRITEAIQYLSLDYALDVSVVYPAAPEQGSVIYSATPEQEKEKEKSEKGENTTVDGNDAPETQGSRLKQCHPVSPEMAKAMVFINLASSHALRNEWDKSRKCLSQACDLVNVHDMPQQALFLAIYIEIQCGNFPVALQMIKRQQMVPYIKTAESHFNEPFNPLSLPGSMVSITNNLKPAWTDNSPWGN